MSSPIIRLRETHLQHRLLLLRHPHARRRDPASDLRDRFAKLFMNDHGMEIFSRFTGERGPK